MAYYMSNGVKVSEGAAGLGAYFGRDDPQAAAGVGASFRAMRGLGQNGPPCPSGCAPMDPGAGGGAHAGAADPAVHAGAYTGTATSRYGCMMEFQRTNNYAQYEECMKAIRLRDMVATEGSEPLPYGTTRRAFREGILGGRGLAPDSFGVRTRPWRDGVFGGGLGQDADGNGTANGNGTAAEPDKILGMSPLTLTALTVGGVVVLVGAFAVRKK